jgi:hypothetical protein
VKCVEEQDDDIYPDIDFSLFELDDVIDSGMKSMPDDLVYKCQLAFILWSIDGREDSGFPPSTLEHHVNADRLMAKLGHVHLALGGSVLDREGFIRDIFKLEHQWLVSAVQYYSFVAYYDDPMDLSNITKLIEWAVFHDDYQSGFAPRYHLERSYSDEFGFTHVLGRKLRLGYHESLIFFDDYCPSYMELKRIIIGDITGEAPLYAVISSGYQDQGPI